MRRVDEAHFHTPDEVREIVQNALTLTGELDPPEDLRAAVFAQACSLLGQKQVIFEQPTPSMMPTMPILRGRG